jgi:hypothetical protein
VLSLLNKNPIRPFTSSIYTRKKRIEKLVEGISSFEIAAEGEKYLYETLSNQFVISKVKKDPAKETLK